MLARKQLTYDGAEAMKVLPHVVAVDTSQQYFTPAGSRGSFAVKYGATRYRTRSCKASRKVNPMSAA
jgi:hypothetical protein